MSSAPLPFSNITGGPAGSLRLQPMAAKRTDSKSRAGRIGFMRLLVLAEEKSESGNLKAEKKIPMGYDQHPGVVLTGSWKMRPFCPLPKLGSNFRTARPPAAGWCEDQSSFRRRGSHKRFRAWPCWSGRRSQVVPVVLIKRAALTVAQAQDEAQAILDEVLHASARSPTTNPSAHTCRSVDNGIPRRRRCCTVAKPQRSATR
jgi:hypothetical protein